MIYVWFSFVLRLLLSSIFLSLSLFLLFFSFFSFWTWSQFLSWWLCYVIIFKTFFKLLLFFSFFLCLLHFLFLPCIRFCNHISLKEKTKAATKLLTENWYCWWKWEDSTEAWHRITNDVFHWFLVGFSVLQVVAEEWFKV